MISFLCSIHKALSSHTVYRFQLWVWMIYTVTFQGLSNSLAPTSPALFSDEKLSLKTGAIFTAGGLTTTSDVLTVAARWMTS